MLSPSYILLYVDAPQASARFYSDLFGQTPVETSPGFALFVLENGVKLGLWARSAVTPEAGAETGGCEIGVAVPQAEDVDATCAAWRERGATILQPPIDLPFGRTFTAADPDGHRIRVVDGAKR